MSTLLALFSAMLSAWLPSLLEAAVLKTSHSSWTRRSSECLQAKETPLKSFLSSPVQSLPCHRLGHSFRKGAWKQRVFFEQDVVTPPKHRR